MDKVKILITEDSNLMRRLLANILAKDARLLVVGMAENGQEALEKIKDLQPDVVTLDLNMPVMDGLTCLRESNARGLTPSFLIVSSLAQKDAQITIDAIGLGAVDYIPKPSQMLGMVQLEKEIIAKVLMAAEHHRSKNSSGAGAGGPAGASPAVAAPAVAVGGGGALPAAGSGTPGVAPGTVPGAAPTGATGLGVAPVAVPAKPRLTIFGGGSGSMQTIQRIVPFIVPSFQGVAIFVLHLPSFFTNQLAAKLKPIAKVNIDEVTDGMPLSLKRVYVAPGGDKNLILARNPPPGKGVVFRLVDNDEMVPETPSVDKFMASAAELFRETCRGIVMTGTGTDGVEGLRAIKRYRGDTFVQDRASAIANQLPTAALQAGVAERMLTIQEIVDLLV